MCSLPGGVMATRQMLSSRSSRTLRWDYADQHEGDGPLYKLTDLSVVPPIIILVIRSKTYPKQRHGSRWNK